MQLISEWHISLGVIQEIFSSCPGCPSIMLVYAVPELGLSHSDGQLTIARGMVWQIPGTHLFQFTPCLRVSLMGNRLMLICYSMHRKSHLMPHCKLNLILARGCLFSKGVCLVRPTCVWRLPPYQCQHSSGLSAALWSRPRSCYLRLTQAVLLHSCRRGDVCRCVLFRVSVWEWKEENKREGSLPLSVLSGGVLLRMRCDSSGWSNHGCHSRAAY